MKNVAPSHRTDEATLLCVRVTENGPENTKAEQSNLYERG